MKITIENYQGIRPRIANEKLPPNEAQTAENCKLTNGDLRPWYNYLLEQLLVNKGIVLTIRLHAGYWLEWEADVDYLQAPISGDTAGKFYYTGDGIPKKSNTSLATTGSGAMPINYYPLALPSPKAALTGSVGGPPNGSGDDRYVSYIWTVVSTWGEESYPSPVSTSYEAKNGERIALSDMTLEWQASTAYQKYNSVFEVSDEGGTYLYKCIIAGTTGSGEPTWNQGVGQITYDGTCTWQCYENNLEYKRIYRLAVGNEYGTYQYADQIAISATTYNDDLEDADLSQDLCPSLSIERGGGGIADFDPPDDDIEGFAYLGNGIALTFKGKDIYPSVAYQLHTFPIEFSQAVPEPIVSITSAGLGTAIVSTDEKMYVINGVSPDSLVVDPLADTKPNLSKRGAVSFKNGVIYPASDGLRYVDAASNTLMTEMYYTTEEWKNLYPSTMHSTIYQRKYFGFYKSGDNEGGIVVDLTTGVVTTLDFYCFATYVDPSTDTLYFIRSAQMSQFKEFFQNPDARSTSGKATQYDLTAGAGDLAGIVQTDYPRNLVVNITDGDASITAMVINITGTYADGSACDQDLTFGTDLAVGENDMNYAMAQITGISVSSVTGAAAGDTIDIGWGKKFGLGNGIDASSDVIKILENDDDAEVANATISTTYDTVQFETDPDASNDYMVMYTTD